MLARREVERPRTLGLVPATSGYIDRGAWEEIIDVQSKPIVVEELRLEFEIGEVDTTWVVYGTTKRFHGEVIGIPSPELFGAGALV